MFHLIILGLLLGWGAAIPIGPVNLEVIRRHLRFGFSSGFLFGLGACSADILYLILLLTGLLIILNQGFWLFGLGIVGAFILAWYGYKAVTLKPLDTFSVDEDRNIYSLPKEWAQGLLMTLLNPYTVLFWVSVSAELAHLSMEHRVSSGVLVGIGVLLGTVSWCFFFNLILSLTRDHLSNKVKHRLNIGGGIILLGFAAFSLWHALMTPGLLK